MVTADKREKEGEDHGTESPSLADLKKAIEVIHNLRVVARRAGRFVTSGFYGDAELLLMQSVANEEYRREDYCYAVVAPATGVTVGLGISVASAWASAEEEMRSRRGDMIDRGYTCELGRFHRVEVEAQSKSVQSEHPQVKERVKSVKPWHTRKTTSAYNNRQLGQPVEYWTTHAVYSETRSPLCKHVRISDLVGNPLTYTEDIPKCPDCALACKRLDRLEKIKRSRKRGTR